MAFSLLVGAGCGDDLKAKITGGQIDLTLIYSKINRMTTEISNTANAHPVPYGTRLTDHVIREMDRLVIDGIIGCKGCLRASDISSIIFKVKTAAVGAVYADTELWTVTTTRAKYQKMLLANATIHEEESTYMSITTTWVQFNLGGTIANPGIEVGGIVG